MKNNNQKIIRTLSKKNLKNNKMRNIFAIIAISLTATLFTALFSIGSGMIQLLEEQTMRQLGTKAHAGLKYVTKEEYEKITSHPLVVSSSYNVIISIADNKELMKRKTELRYAIEDEFKYNFITLKEGRLPKEENEIVLDTIVLDMLGISPQLGEEITLTFPFIRGEQKKTFILSGWYEGDLISPSSMAYISESYCKELTKNYTSQDLKEEYQRTHEGYGLLMVNINFKNSYNIEKNIQKVIEESGYIPEKEINYGVNWAYLSEISKNELDIFSFITAIMVFLIILITGYLIIYNIFQISITRDIHFYGLLKTIGATKEQLKHLILRQALLLSIIGIPIGLLLGYIIGKLIFPLFNTLTQTINQIEFHIKLNPFILLFGTIFSFFTVLISCRKPSKTAGEVSPIEAVKYTEYSNQHQNNKLHQKNTKQKQKGVSICRMALKNLKRNRKKTILVILSLSLSVILLTQLYTLIKGFRLTKYMDSMVTGDFLIGSVSLFQFSPEIGYELSQDYKNICENQEGIESIEQIYFNENKNIHTLSEKGIQGLQKKLQEGKITIWDDNIQKCIDLTLEGKLNIDEERYAYSEGLLNNLIVRKGTFDYEKFKSGDYILLADTEGTEFHAYYEPGDKIILNFGTIGTGKEIRDDDGAFIAINNTPKKQKTYEVMAIVDIPYGMTCRAFPIYGITTILPIEEIIKMDENVFLLAESFMVEDDKEKTFETFLKEYTKTIDPTMNYESKERIRDSFSQMKNGILFIGSSLSFIVGVIGIINFTNTMLTNIVTRKQEFAILQSIGLTNEQLKKMLIYEGIYYIGIAGIFSLLIGSILSVSLIQSLNNILAYFEYRFTILPFICLIPLSIIIAFVIPLISYQLVKKYSIVERLRMIE